MILASEEKARKITDKPVWITAWGRAVIPIIWVAAPWVVVGPWNWPLAPPIRWRGLRIPESRSRWLRSLNSNSYQELLWSEGLGFCGKGEGGKLIESGVTALQGEIPINPSGGVLSGIPTLVAGMSRVAETVLQLRGEAGARQVMGARTAVAQGMDGPGAQLHSVIVLNS